MEARPMEHEANGDNELRLEDASLATCGLFYHRSGRLNRTMTKTQPFLPHSCHIQG